jgi:hypothetical protein
MPPKRSGARNTQQSPQSLFAFRCNHHFSPHQGERKSIANQCAGSVHKVKEAILRLPIMNIFSMFFKLDDLPKEGTVDLDSTTMSLYAKRQDGHKIQA